MGDQYGTHERKLPSKLEKVVGLKQNLDAHQHVIQTSH